ncbi:MAG: DUF2303 family protein [Brevundimonas diminuta]|nr:DUF2303 family protein [Brevundimonas diminuta]MBD3817903.1 DUF2303 family protein [Brevundimonas diminuta]
MTDTHTTEAAAIAALGASAAAASVIAGADGRAWLIQPSGTTATEITDPHGMILTSPARVKQAVVVQTADSLVDYVDLYGQDETILFADIEASTIRGLIDYHGAALAELGTPSVAKHVDHRVTLTLPFSEEWRTWKAIDGKMLDQLSFARFLEENAVDIEAPSGADLLEVCRDLQAVRRVDFRKAVRTNTDNENFEYTDETETRTKNGSVEVPSKFQLRIPVYFGGQTVTLYAFLRWRLVETSLELGIQLHRAEHVRQAVFKEIVTDASSRTGKPALFGKVD